MNHLADDELRARLAGFEEPVDFVDANGRLLGRFIPAVPKDQAALHERYKHVFDLEAAERALQNKAKGRTIREFLEHFHAQGK